MLRLRWCEPPSGGSRHAGRPFSLATPSREFRHCPKFEKRNGWPSRETSAAFARRIQDMTASAANRMSKKFYSAASRKPGTSSEYLCTCRGRPIRTGWNSTAAAIVHSSASAISLPMLDMPG
jgi:hypothetical protein